jgi:alpha-amylase/alpha-mannosidase (GH57 family)
MPFHFSVHGHFYQPSREDALTGLIPIEPSASPYPNWNECIYQRCYRSNAEQGNFRKISFDIGPTLFRWLEQEHPETCQQILEQERENFQLFGVSNAMAQSYYHIILPLASRRDKQTQLRWGIREYHHRFQHAPQGLWLPETAVDLETLELLAEEDIQFTILAPWQAVDGKLDTRQPSRLELPGGHSIVIFYYEASLSGQVSFYPSATRNATRFVQEQVLPAYQGEDGSDKLLLVASDGELYGHHQRFRDKFLAYLLDGAANEAGLDALYPARWLVSFPVEKETMVQPNTSWSCHHGIERWRGVCGDAPLANWKAPLRAALDHLASAIDRLYEETLQPFVRDAWQIRDDYIQVILKQKNANELIQEHLQAQISDDIMKLIQLLLEAQDNRMKMFASDAWFFEEFDRIEPHNAIQYAAYSAWLVKRATGVDVHSALKNDLAKAISLDGRTSGDAVFSSYWDNLNQQPDSV